MRIVSGATLLTTLAYLLGVDALTVVPLTAVAIVAVAVLTAVYSGYIGGGIVSSAGVVCAAVLWIQLVPPTAALLLGEESVTWYGTPWPLPVQFTPYEELMLGVRYGSIVALVAATVLGPLLYLGGLTLGWIHRAV